MKDSDRVDERRNPNTGELRLAPATRADVAAILAMIHGLAQFEQLSPLCIANESDIERALFGDTHSKIGALAGGRPAQNVLFPFRQ